MKTKLITLLEILMKKQYKAEIIHQAIFLPTVAKNPQEFMDKLIEIAKKSETEEKFFRGMEELTVTMI